MSTTYSCLGCVHADWTQRHGSNDEELNITWCNLVDGTVIGPCPEWTPDVTMPEVVQTLNGLLTALERL